MSLELYRGKLKECLAVCDGSTKGAVLDAINNWWLAYKDWEAEETFSRAFTERRMTVRTIKYETQHKDLKITRLAEPDKGKQSAQGISDTGITGLMKRIDPASFVSRDDARTSAKYSLGLHDMSASLLNPDREIVHQLYGWGFQTDSDAVTKPTSYYVMFMPLAKTEDMALFSTLLQVSKELRTKVPEIYEKVRDIRSQFTRIKFADKDDSHIGFVDVSKKDAPKPKYRYGLSNEEAEKGSVDTERTRARRSAALMYTGILESAQERAARGFKQTNKFYNEIIVAYRKHASPKFPLFTRWNNGGFQVVRAIENGMTDVSGQSISTKGVCTGF